MFVCFQYMAGFASFRNPDRGSRYVQTLVKVFMEDAHDSDIYDMLDKVHFLPISRNLFLKRVH